MEMNEIPCAMNTLQARNITLKYDSHVVIDSISVDIPRGKITVLIGSNGCGKSTMLKAFGRLLTPASGQVLLNGKDIQRYPNAKVAHEIAVLPQTPIVPEGVTVFQLACLGRYPHQSWWQQWTHEDEAAVNRALQQTQLTQLKNRRVDSLSGGQRQRAWIAMTLSQDTNTLLLDEPTTYLDLAHQIDVLDLLYDLNIQQNKTIVMVLHDLNLACRYAHHIIALNNGSVYAQGAPEQIMNASMVKAVFGLGCQIVADPLYGSPMCIPMGKGRTYGQQ